MSNDKQSSVEWLISQLTEVNYNCINKTFLQSNNSLAGYKMIELFEQAKAMHKEEIIQAWKNGDGQFDKVAEQMSLEHYNEKYN